MKKGKIYIFNYIGAYGTSPQDIADVITAYKAEGIEEFIVYIHSPGGSIFDGLAIYNLLKEENVEIRIIGYAASMASVIALAGETVRMSQVAHLMIHNPRGEAYGDSEEMKRTGKLLDQLADTMVGIYHRKTKIPKPDILKMMDETTWLTADQALEQGFIDEIIDPVDNDEATNLYEGLADYTNLVATIKQENEIMDKKKLIAMLGLKAEATDTEIEAAIVKMKADATAKPKTDPPVVPDPKLEVKDGDSPEMVALKERLQKLEGRVNTQTSEAATAKAAALVEKHKKIIPPASMETAQKLALADPEGFEAFVKNLPSLSGAGDDPTKVDPESGEDELEAYFRAQDKKTK